VTVVLDASVALRWFVDQPGAPAAAAWLRRFVRDPDLFVAPDLLPFEVHGGLARLQARRDPGWAAACFDRFLRLGLRILPTSEALFSRAFELAQTLRMGGYDAVYLAHAEDLGLRWLTADARALRRLVGDSRVRALEG